MNTKHFLRAVFAILSLAVAIPASAQTCRSDLNGDGQVNGADLGIMLADWGFCPATITSVTPLQGGTQGGTVIAITGTGLSTTSSVKIGGVACTNLNVLTSTLVQSTTPAGVVGQASIAVTTSAGTTLASTPFNYVQQQITSIVPNTGLYVGGTPITISGQYLAGTTAVTIGGVPCTNVVSVSTTQVTAVTPAGSVGAMDVVVNCPKGAVTVGGGFTYLAAIVPSWATLIEAQPDPTVVTDPSLRAAIIATGLAWRVRDTGTQIEMLLLPAGTFMMGCTASNTYACLSFENPMHQVTLTQAFYMGRYEVTQAQWTAKMGSNPSFFVPANGYSSDTTKPVEQVSWNIVQSFNSVTGLRLPTEAEWEYACRAGTTTAFHSMPGYQNGTNDDNQVGTIAWYGSYNGGNSGSQTHAVGGKAANALGLHDMSGNVYEWVNDWYGGTYYSVSPSTNPLGPMSGSGHVLRGGAWYHLTNYVRSSYRLMVSPDPTNKMYGFRVARNP
jgi:formylglycine-generating enzyme required for sulfatase activity